MADSFARLYQGQAATAAATLYTVPGATQTIIRHIRCVNASTSATASVTLYNGGTADANLILNTITLQPLETYTEDCFIGIDAADTIAGKASAASTVTVSVYGGSRSHEAETQQRRQEDRPGEGLRGRLDPGQRGVDVRLR